MDRRSFLAGATGAAALVGGIGSAQAARRPRRDVVEYETFEVVGDDRSQDSSIDVTAVDGGRVVTVEGTIETANPCHDVSLGDARVEDGWLRVPVETTRQKGVCITVSGAFQYEAGFFLNREVNGVVVEHDGLYEESERVVLEEEKEPRDKDVVQLHDE